MITTIANPGNSCLPSSTNHQNSSQDATECLNTLRLFILPGQITQLVVLDAREPGRNTPMRYAGYFDYDHLENMAQEANRFSGLARGVYFTLNPLRSELLNRCPNRIQRARTGALGCNSDVVCRTWLMIDLDPRRPAGTSATDPEKWLAWNTQNLVAEFLRNGGFPEPIIGDSGNGYHLYYRINLQHDDRLPHQLLKMLSDRFGSNEVTIDTTVASASQLTKLFGTLSAKGSATIDRPHRRSTLLSVPNLTVLDTAALSRLLPPVQLPSVQLNSSQTASASASGNVINRARRYVAAMPLSRTGDHGHDRLFEVACRLIQGFALSIAESLPLLREYNTRAEPPWNECELLHKLESAMAQTGSRPRGYLLTENVESTRRIQTTASERTRDGTSVPLTGPKFPIAIPDFVPVPTTFVTDYLSPSSIELPRGRPRFDHDCYRHWLALYGIFEQRITPVVIPDALLAIGMVGASPQRSWRNRLFYRDGSKRLSVEAMRLEIHRLRSRLGEHAVLLQAAMAQDPSGLHETLVESIERMEVRRKQLEKQCPPTNCPSHCPLHCCETKHKHYLLRPDENFLGPLTAIATKFREGEYRLDFNMKLEGERSILDSLVRSNQVHRAYLPVQLFGQAAGLNVRQIRLLQGLMRERTRTNTRHSNQTSKPRLVLIRNARVKAVLKDQEVTCPFLDLNERYVVFGGNLKNRRGRGYRLVGTFSEDGRRQGGWLRRLGYPVTSQMEQMEEERIWKWIRLMLSDLAVLSQSLNLVVGAIDKSGNWRSLVELQVMIDEARFRPWLRTCSLRIFAPADHLVRWRRWFAEQLGLSFIPGGDWSPPQDVALAVTNRPTAETIRSQMAAYCIKGKQLAEFLGWTESRVSRQLSAKTALSNELIAAARQLMPVVPMECQ